MLSLALFCVWVAASWLISRGRRLGLRLLIGLVLFVLFVWLSPQIYYQYYRLIIDGLPAQFVIGWPRGAAHIAELLLFQAEENLSAHGQGLLGWALLVTAGWRNQRA